MVSADLPTPPAPTTTNLYSVIFGFRLQCADWWWAKCARCLGALGLGICATTVAVSSSLVSDSLTPPLTDLGRRGVHTTATVFGAVLLSLLLCGRCIWTRRVCCRRTGGGRE